MHTTETAFPHAHVQRTCTTLKLAPVADIDDTGDELVVVDILHVRVTAHSIVIMAFQA